MYRFRQLLLELCGYKIWPPHCDDPGYKGPPPRILTRRQWEAMEKMCRETRKMTEIPRGAVNKRREMV